MNPVRRTTLTIRTPLDLVALAQVTHGFVPEESLVMLSLGEGQFHARLDLPPDDEIDEAVEVLVEPVLRHCIERVALVAFSADPARARPYASALADALRAHSVDVLDVLHSDSRRWRHLCGVDDEPHPYDLDSHPFMARAVLDGEVPTRTRADVVASVAADPAAVAAVREAMVSLRGGHRSADRAWILRRVEARRVPVRPADIARLLVAMLSVECRDLAWMVADRDNAAELTRFWQPLVTASPPGLVAPVASLLAFCAWLSGDGALAWCAVERALEDDPDYSMADGIARLLQGAISPRNWPGLPRPGCGLTGA